MKKYQGLLISFVCFGIALIQLQAQNQPALQPAAAPALPAIPEMSAVPVVAQQPVPAMPTNEPAVPTLPVIEQPAIPVLQIPTAPAQIIQPVAAPQVSLPALPVQEVAAQPVMQASAPLPPLPPVQNVETQPVAQAPAQPTSSATTGTGQVAPSEEKNIYLNFENTSLTSFIDYMAEQKKLNILPDKALEGSQISLTIREPLSIDGAWNVFLTVLEMAGFSIVKVGELHRIVPKDKKLTQPLPAYINVPYTSLPDSDLTIRYVVFLTNISVADIRPVLDSMLSSPNVLIDQKDMNAFIITDKSYNIKAAVKLIQELDQAGMPESVTVLRLKRANATDVKTLMESLIKKPEGNPLARLLGKAAEGGAEYFSSTTRIIAEERTNSLILLGNTKSVDKVIDFIKTHIDGQISEAESPLHIFELQHIDAAQVATILKEVTAIPDSATGTAAGKFGSIRGGVKYFKGMNFQVDKDGNRLIASCLDKQDWRLLKKTIQDLDKPQPQVALEGLLVTVSSNDIKKLGGAIRNKKAGDLGRHVDAQAATLGAPSLVRVPTPPATGGVPTSLLGNMLSQLVAEQGQTLLTFGNTAKENGVWGVFRMLKQQTNASILSQPYVTVANKTAAKISVGEKRRIVSEEITNAGAGSTASQGYVDAEAATTLEITPQINLDGVIRLKVKIDIVDFVATDKTGNTKTQKTVETNVSVADGQVLVLGGFIKTKVDETKNKSPLADIPIIGWFLGKNQERTITKEYLFLFLAPTIIKPRQQPGMQLYTKMKMHQATQDIESAVETKRTIDPVHNWFFNPDKENYSHKVIDFANARYQPTTVDIKNDLYYRSSVSDEEAKEAKRLNEMLEAKTPEIKPLAMADQSIPANNVLAFSAAPLPDVTSQVIQMPPVIPMPTFVPPQPKPILPEPAERPSLAPAVQTIKPVIKQVPVQVQKPLKQNASKASLPAEDSGMSALKNILELTPPLQSQPQKEKEEITIDIEKRNVLKDFLSAHRRSMEMSDSAKKVEKSRA